jgi:hypothetical protein
MPPADCPAGGVGVPSGRPPWMMGFCRFSKWTLGRMDCCCCGDGTGSGSGGGTNGPWLRPGMEMGSTVALVTLGLSTCEGVDRVEILDETETARLGVGLAGMS